MWILRSGISKADLWGLIVECNKAGPAIVSRPRRLGTRIGALRHASARPLRHFFSAKRMASPGFLSAERIFSATLSISFVPQKGSRMS